MKRVVVILAVCIVLFTLLGINTYAAGPDTTPPQLWAVGMSTQAVETVACLGSTSVMVQAKAWDLNGIPYVQTQFKRPGDLTWRTRNMALKGDGYWRYWIPRTAFGVEYVGTWQVRVVAYDTFGNATKSGVKTLQVTTCPAP